MNGRSFSERQGEKRGRPGGRARLRRPRDTRAAILQAAYALVLHQGYHGTSMRQIAHEAHVTPAAIYNHFDGKEAIFLALLAERMPQRALVRALSTVEGGTVEGLIHDAFRRMGAAMEDQFDNLRLLFVELLEFQGRHARHVAEEFLPQALAFMNRVQSAEGDLRPLDPMIVARAFLGLFMSYAITVAFFPRVPGLVARDSDLQDLGNILLHGLLAPPPGSDAAGNTQGGEVRPGVA